MRTDHANVEEPSPEGLHPNFTSIVVPCTTSTGPRSGKRYWPQCVARAVGELVNAISGVNCAVNQVVSAFIFPSRAAVSVNDAVNGPPASRSETSLTSVVHISCGSAMSVSEEIFCQAHD